MGLSRDVGIGGLGGTILFARTGKTGIDNTRISGESLMRCLVDDVSPWNGIPAAKTDNGGPKTSREVF